MLTSTSLLAAVAALVMSSATVQARPMHAGIDYHRYLQDREDVKMEMQAWKIKFNEIASANGFIPHSESRSVDDEEEDQLQRFFLTKDHIHKMSLENPDATFSTDSPFSLMTDGEFTSYVTNSHVLRNTSSSPSNSRRLRNGHVHSWGRTSSTTSKTSTSGNTATTSTASTTASSSDYANLQGTSGGTKTTTKVTTSTVNGVTTTTTTKTTTTSSGATTTETSVVRSGSSDVTSSGYDFSNLINNWWPSSTTATPTATTATPTTTRATPKTTTATPVTTTATPSTTTGTATASDSDSVDWTTSGCISAVQDQGNCGDCWAFSSVAAVEAAQCLASSSKTLPKYSEQQLVSCDTQNYGCGGGAPAYALDFIKENGLCTETAYPYTSGTTGSSGSCSTSCSTTSTGITGYVDIADEDALISALADRPVIVAVAAGNNAWKQYSSGILSSCDTSALDHAVLVVGYDSTSFKIKNSWGSTWGESGYIRLSRETGSTGTCGMYTDMYQPTI